MSKFGTKIIEAIKGKQRFEQLIILPDHTDLSKLDLKSIDGVWDEYEKLLEGKYSSSFRGITAIMDRVANLQSLPNDKFKDVTPEKEIVKEYEFKYQDLRVYAIKIPNGKLIVLGGFKNQQGADYLAFRALKKRYLGSIKDTS